MKKIDVINGLRGFAIIGVIWQHLFWDLINPGWHSIDWGGVRLLPFTLLSNGWVGVNLFFILSGFVLFLPYASGQRRFDSMRDVTSYYTHRGSRLLPLYYISVLFFMFFSQGANTDPAFFKKFLLMLTVTFNFTNDMWFPSYNPVLWSLGIEIWFSVFFPALVLLSQRMGGAGRLFILAAALSLATRFAGIYFPVFDTGLSYYQNSMKDSLLGRLDDFVLGMLICQVYINGFRSRVFSFPYPAFFAGIVLILAECTLWDYEYLNYISKLYIPLISNVFHAAFFLIITSLLTLRNGPLRLVFTNYPVQVLGVMCYSLYVWHRVAQFVIIDNVYNATRLSYYFFFLLVFSALSYRYIEFGGKKASEVFLLERG